MGAVTGLGTGKSNDWYTPSCFFEALGCRFNMDVAAPRSGPLHVPCASYLWADSLNQPWSGFIWMNAPFGGRNGLRPWLDKFFDHGNGIALTPDRTSAPWFHEAWARAGAVMFTRKIPFLRPNGQTDGSPAFGTTLWAVGREGVDALNRAHLKGFGLLCVPERRRAA